MIGRSGVSEPVGYTVAAMIALTVVSAILDKGGVPANVLSWVVFALVTVLIVISANTIWPLRMVGYATADRSASAPVIAVAQFFAIGPAGLLLAYWAAPTAADSGIVPTVAGIVAGLWFSVLVIGVRLNRSGAFSLPEFLAARYQSEFIRILAMIMPAIAVFLLICSQMVAFGDIAFLVLGLDSIAAVVLFALAMVATIWFSGMRGVLLASASCGAVLLIATATLYWLLGFGDPVSAAGAQVGPVESLGQIAPIAMPFLPQADAQIISSAGWFFHAAMVALALAATPVFTQFHPVSASGLRTIRTALASTVLFGVAVAIVYGFARANWTMWVPNQQGEGQFLVTIVKLAVLSALPVTGAILLFGLSAVISLGGKAGVAGAPVAEHGRLIFIRMIVVFAAIAAAWASIAWREQIVAVTPYVFYIAMASILPVTVASMWWKQSHGLAAGSAMTVGAAVTSALAAAKFGWLDLSTMVAEPNALLAFLADASAPAAGLIGGAIGTLILVLVAFMPGRRRPQGDRLFAGIEHDQNTRPLNEAAL